MREVRPVDYTCIMERQTNKQASSDEESDTKADELAFFDKIIAHNFRGSLWKKYQKHWVPLISYKTIQLSYDRLYLALSLTEVTTTPPTHYVSFAVPPAQTQVGLARDCSRTKSSFYI